LPQQSWAHDDYHKVWKKTQGPIDFSNQTSAAAVLAEEPSCKRKRGEPRRPGNARTVTRIFEQLVFNELQDFLGRISSQRATASRRLI
jgi:hypothetical protein